MTKTYKYEEIFSDIEGDDENVLMTIPPEICEGAGFKIGDVLNMKIEDGKLVLSKSAKIYESPDKGKTIYEREFGAHPSTRKLIKTSVQQQWDIQYKDEK